VGERTGGAPAAFYSRQAFGERLGGFIYGTIVVLSVVIAGARIYPDGPGHVAVFVIVTIVVLWLAHVYAHGLAESVTREEHLSRAELGHVARGEASILEAGVPPVAALLLGAAGIISEQAAVWLAIALGLGVLAAQGVVYAHVGRLGWAATAAVVTLNLGLGLLLIWLKLVVGHG
jgi:hypothetical protein